MRSLEGLVNWSRICRFLCHLGLWDILRAVRGSPATPAPEKHCLAAKQSDQAPVPKTTFAWILKQYNQVKAPSKNSNVCNPLPFSLSLHGSSTTSSTTSIKLQKPREKGTIQAKSRNSNITTNCAQPAPLSTLRFHQLCLVWPDLCSER